MLVSGSNPKHMVMVYIFGQMVIVTKESGKWDSNMVTGQIYLRLEILTLANITKDKCMEKVSTLGQLVKYITVIISMVKDTVKDSGEAATI